MHTPAEPFILAAIAFRGTVGREAIERVMIVVECQSDLPKRHRFQPASFRFLALCDPLHKFFKRWCYILEKLCWILQLGDIQLYGFFNRLDRYRIQHLCQHDNQLLTNR